MTLDSATPSLILVSILLALAWLLALIRGRRAHKAHEREQLRFITLPEARDRWHDRRRLYKRPQSTQTPKPTEDTTVKTPEPVAWMRNGELDLIDVVGGTVKNYTYFHVSEDMYDHIRKLCGQGRRKEIYPYLEANGCSRNDYLAA